MASQSGSRQLGDVKLLPVALSTRQVVLQLLVQPALGGRAEGQRQANGHLCADTGPSIQDAGEGLTAYTECRRGFGHGQPQWLQTELTEDFAGMGRVVHLHRAPSVVVLVVDPIDVLADKHECDAPISTHANGPGASSVASKFVQVQALEIHVARAGRDVEAAENQSKPFRVFRLDSGLGARAEEPLEAFVPKSLDRH